MPYAFKSENPPSENQYFPGFKNPKIRAVTTVLLVFENIDF